MNRVTTVVVFVLVALVCAPNVGAGVMYPRTNANVYHVGTVVFGGGPAEATQRARELKKQILGSAAAAPYMQSSTAAVNLAVHIEFSVSDFSKDQQAFYKNMDDVVRAWLSEGFAVYVLLPLHYEPTANWQGYDWKSTRTGSVFCPYRPTASATSFYDVLSQKYQGPVIQHLLSVGLLDQVAGVLVANEFDYENVTTFDSGWSCSGKTPTQCRAEALVYTTERVLKNARLAAAGHAAVGVKLTWVTRPGGAYVAGAADQLAYLLKDVMGPNGDLLGYDAYWNGDNMYDASDHERLKQAGLSLFQGNGRLVLSEWSRICGGWQCNIKSGSRTSSYEGYGVLGEWQDARGVLLFAYNPTSPVNDVNGHGCHAIYDSATGYCAGGIGELQMLGDQMRSVITATQRRWFDGAESKGSGWSLGNWTVENTAPYQGSYRFRCLPNANATMTSPTFSLSSATLATLRYAYKYQLPEGAALYVEISGDAGTSWTTLAKHVGTATSGTAWLVGAIGVPEAIVGRSQCRVRFRYATSISSSYFGAAVDNVEIVTK